MNNIIIDNLILKAKYIRDEVIRVACKNNAGHIASSLSCIDILVSLYYHIMWPFDAQVWPYNKEAWDNRDKFILSKAHGCYGLYAILTDLGIMPREIWEDMGKSMSILKGCCIYKPEWGLDAGCGSLGHGLSIAVGLAYSAKLQNKKYNVYCLVGDGELQEGSNWEAIEFACRQHLDNLILIVDINGLQAMEETPYNTFDIGDRLVAFGFDYNIINGHNMEELIVMPGISFGNPRAFLCKTVKGKGLKCIENKPEFHYRIPTIEELKDYGEINE